MNDSRTDNAQRSWNAAWQKASARFDKMHPHDKPGSWQRHLLAASLT